MRKELVEEKRASHECQKHTFTVPTTPCPDIVFVQDSDFGSAILKIIIPLAVSLYSTDEP